MKVQRTLVFLKPEMVARGLIGEALTRIERKGLKIRAAKLLRFSRELAEKLYEAHKGKHFFEDLISHVTSGPIFAMVVEGPDAVSVMRKLIGATNPIEAEPGTIRGDYALHITSNAIHASDSAESAEREAALLFKEEEFI